MPEFRNLILRSLPQADREALIPHLEPLALRLRKKLQEQNHPIQHVYFLESGLASVVHIGGANRKQAEIAVIGFEGLSGLPALQGASRSPTDTFMQVAGTAVRVDAEVLSKLMLRSIRLSSAIHRYAHVFALQVAGTALANAAGTIHQRLARWLLMAHDRVGRDDLPLTHDFLALMLSVRRAGVTEALNVFRLRGVIQQTRGTLSVVDRAALLEIAGGFYGIPEAEFGRLFSAKGGTHKP